MPGCEPTQGRRRTSRRANGAPAKCPATTRRTPSMSPALKKLKSCVRGGVGAPGCEPMQGWMGHVQAGQRRTCGVGQRERERERERELVCLDVSRYRGVDAFPGGPTAHLRGGPEKGGGGGGGWM